MILALDPKESRRKTPSLSWNLQEYMLDKCLKSYRIQIYDDFLIITNFNLSRLRCDGYSKHAYTLRHIHAMLIHIYPRLVNWF